MSGISLTASMRPNLLSLKNTSSLIDMTQNRLSTGNKVNSAIDNPSSYYTARSLNNRANYLTSLLDSMGQAVSTIKAASETLESGLAFLEQASASANIKNISINASGEQLYGISATNGGKITLDNANNIKVSGTDAQKIWFRDENLYNGKANTAALINKVGADALAATACSQFYVGDKNGEFGQGNWYLPAIGELMNVYGYDTSQITGVGDNKATINNTLSTLASKGAEATILTDNCYWSSSEYSSGSSWLLYMSDCFLDYLYENNNYYVRSFQLVENCFNPLTLSADAPGGSGSGAAAIDNSFTEQYNAVVAQYDALINDGSYKGVNLLKNESLSVRFNEDGSSILNITGKDMSSITLGMTEAKWTSVSDVDASVTKLKNAINLVRTFSTELGNNYSIVQTREDFTENLINVLTEGADKLTLADMNEESANILALQTRQQLAINSLSLAAQSAQAVLKLF